MLRQAARALPSVSAMRAAAVARPLGQGAHTAAAAAAMNDRAQAARARHVVLSLAGADRVGIVSDFTAAALEHGANVEETRMARLGGDFCIIGMLSVPVDKDPKSLAAVFQDVFPHFNVTCRHTDVPEDAAPKAAVAEEWAIELEGPDQLGIVAAVTEELAKAGANIHELETETVQAPFAGFALFKLETSFGVDASKVDAVAQAMSNVENRFGVSVILSKADQDSES